MRRRYVSDEDRDTIVRLRRSGAGWLKIQEMTGIPRRTAKSVCERWQVGQAAEDMTTARRQVAAEAFNSHMGDLIALAHRISDGLDAPGPADRRGGSQVLESILQTEIHGRSQDKPRYSFYDKNTEDVKRQNRILFDSLKEHTKEKIDWNTLDDWVSARDEWKRAMDKLESIAVELVHKVYDMEGHEGELISTIKSDEKLVTKMARCVAETVYRIKTADKHGQAGDYIKARSGQDGVGVFFGEGASETELAVVGQDLAMAIAAICIWVVDLTEGKKLAVVQRLVGSFQRMSATQRGLAEKLEELRLMPLILRTRCEICPA